MIEKTRFAFVFYLKNAPVIEIVTEDEGLTMDQFRSDIEQCMEDEQYYTMHDIIEDEWTIINARKIIAFKIKDVGAGYDPNSEEGFQFK